VDPTRISTESTTDHEPPSVTSLTPGPTQAPTSSATGRRRRTGAIVTVVALALVATFSAGIGVGGAVVTAIGGSSTATPNPASATATDLELFAEAWDTIQRRYVARGELDDRSLIYGAIDGLTEAVGDTGHTDFLTPEERQARSQALSGSYVGIGVRIDLTEDGRPRIVAVFPDSPAAAAGLAAGDVIVEVDGQSTTGTTIDEVASRVRGEPGTTVNLAVSAAGTGPVRSMAVVRADVPVHPVSWTMVPGTTTALVRLEQFSTGAADEVSVALTDARTDGAERVVLDLRGNPGGYVTEAVGVASQFLATGVVYIERDADGKETAHQVTGAGVATDLPLVVLVDGHTASSSEIVSGALQDAGRATIVGQTTYGTGTVLGEFPLADGSALRIGTVEWLTPQGRRIWHAGITPDVPVAGAEGTLPLLPDAIASMSADQLATLADPQMVRALELVAVQAVASR
jgi:carboxyl-terminal processing protease